MNPTHLIPMPREPTLWSSLRALPRPVWVLFSGTFINKFGAFVVPFLTIYLTRQGYTVGQAALAVGAYGVGNLVASILGGHLADQWGRRETIVFSMFSGAIAMLLLSQARTLPVIILLTALVGLTGELYRPACSALLADLIPPGQRVTAFAMYRVALNAGFAFGPALAGFLATRGFFWLFVGDALTSMLFGLVALFALPRSRRSQQRDATWAEALAVLRQDRKLHQVLLANLAIGLVFFQITSTFGLHVMHLGFSAAVYGAIFSMNGALVMLCELPLTTMTRRFPARRVMALGYLLVGIGFVLNAFAHGIPALVLCMVIFTFGEMLTMPVAAAFVADLAPAPMRGRYLGASGLTWAAALIFGPGLGMKLYTFNPAIYWLACGGLGLFAAVVILARLKPQSSPAGLAEKAVT